MENDHDIMIEMRTILKGVVEDFRVYRKDNYTEMEKIRVSIHELVQRKLDLTEYARDAFNTTEALKAHEVRFQRLERLVYIAVGILGVAQFLAPFVMSKF